MRLHLDAQRVEFRQGSDPGPDPGSGSRRSSAPGSTERAIFEKADARAFHREVAAPVRRRRNQGGCALPLNRELGGLRKLVRGSRDSSRCSFAVAYVRNERDLDRFGPGRSSRRRDSVPSPPRRTSAALRLGADEIADAPQRSASAEPRPRHRHLPGGQPRETRSTVSGRPPKPLALAFATSRSRRGCSRGEAGSCSAPGTALGALMARV